MPIPFPNRFLLKTVSYTMKYVFLGLFFLTACSPSTEKPVANTALEKNSFEHLSPKAYLEILEDSLYNTQADLSKAAPAFVRSENWEAGFLIYEHQAFEGQKTGFLTVWEAQDHDLVMKIENYAVFWLIFLLFLKNNFVIFENQIADSQQKILSFSFF